ncbi:glycosyltransferase family 39 protein [Catenuloplanes atrovinosus]|uniref:Glycosyltransferase RgtA/B/C/D-like domain-containing protein n=1 Tax=Catenuloplanes atrovinosus TaxID=137266 RepID=A0AAE4CAF7_9ACTN|nr:glycosyltransferase family 39 protein [Catenuloplanes atrovinosus]MDR7277556.1 hypothetical protein [Catenuloplanes atrovinosus]
MRILALLVVILGSAARVARWFADRPLWLDEQMIAINIRDRGFAGLATDLAHDQSAPIGWLWSERVVLLILGDGERALRLIPLLFGIGTLVLAYYAGRRLLGPAGTLALVTLLAVNGSLMRYATELKQYSADAFTVLLLLFLAIAAIRRPAAEPPSRWTGPLAFWGAAAISGLFSTAAIMVMPGIALVMLIVAVRDAGPVATVRRHAAGVALWILSIGVHYVLALRFAIGDTALAALNARLGFPPEGLVPTVRWLIRRPFTLAGDPIGVPGTLGAAFWLLAGAGVLAALLLPRRASLTPAPAGSGEPAGASASSGDASPGDPSPSGDAPASGAEAAGPSEPHTGAVAAPGWRSAPRWALGVILAAPVVTAFAAAAVHAVPLYGRFAIQLLPPLFIAVGIATDLIVATLVRSLGTRLRSLSALRSPAVAVRTLVAAAGAALLTAVAVLALAPAAVATARPAPLTNGVDDRSAVAAIAAARQDGDLLLVTPSAWPAIKWYAGATTLAPVNVLWTGCKDAKATPLADTARGYSRLLVYAGMQAGGTPGEAKIAAALTDFGTVSGPDKFGIGALYTVILRPATTTPPPPPGTPTPATAAADTCLGVTTPRE